MNVLTTKQIGLGSAPSHPGLPGSGCSLYGAVSFVVAIGHRVEVMSLAALYMSSREQVPLIL